MVEKEAALNWCRACTSGRALFGLLLIPPNTYSQSACTQAAHSRRGSGAVGATPSLRCSAAGAGGEAAATVCWRIARQPQGLDLPGSRAASLKACLGVQRRAVHTGAGSRAWGRGWRQLAPGAVHQIKGPNIAKVSHVLLHVIMMSCQRGPTGRTWTAGQLGGWGVNPGGGGGGDGQCVGGWRACRSAQELHKAQVRHSKLSARCELPQPVQSTTRVLTTVSPPYTTIWLCHTAALWLRRRGGAAPRHRMRCHVSGWACNKRRAVSYIRSAFLSAVAQQSN